MFPFFLDVLVFCAPFLPDEANKFLPEIFQYDKKIDLDPLARRRE